MVFAQPGAEFLPRGQLEAAGDLDHLDPVPGVFVLGVERVDQLADVATIIARQEVDQATRCDGVGGRHQDGLNDRASSRGLDVALRAVVFGHGMGVLAVL